MVYGDLQFIDLIIFGGVAIFLIYRLRGVLGKRAGIQKKDLGKNSDLVQDSQTNKKTNQPLLKENESKLAIAYESLPGFDHKNFIEGAKFAFETIVNAFNSGDKKTLKTLLTKNVLTSFEEAINESKNNPDSHFYSLVIGGVEDVVVIKNTIFITLKITSEQLKDNDESSIIKKQDIWTFQKEIDSKSPIWLLSST
jgi:predicted lipid-binding transport protein (Tim44 family)